MARVEGTCACSVEGCTCPKNEGDWVDAVTGICRDCEIEHGERWGHHNPNVKAEPGKQYSGENSIF